MSMTSLGFRSSAQALHGPKKMRAVGVGVMGAVHAPTSSPLTPMKRVVRSFVALRGIADETRSEGTARVARLQ